MASLNTASLSQSAAVTTEATIVTADANFRNDLTCLVVNQSAAGTVTIRNTTTGASILGLIFPAAGIQVVPFPIPAQGAGVNTNWTAAASAGTATVTAFFVKGA